jgi:hypothetical protein
LLEDMKRRRLRRHKPKLQVEAMTAARKGESGRENVKQKVRKGGTPDLLPLNVPPQKGDFQ